MAVEEGPTWSPAVRLLSDMLSIPDAVEGCPTDSGTDGGWWCLKSKMFSVDTYEISELWGESFSSTSSTWNFVSCAADERALRFG